MSESLVKPGFSRADAVVIMVLVFLLTGLFGCGMSTQTASTGASQSATGGSAATKGGGGGFLDVMHQQTCMNQLRQLGIALHTYHGDNLVLPTEGGTGASFYVQILEYVEQQGKDKNPVAIKLFLCPSRRGTSVGPKRDYGYGGSKLPGSVGESALDAKAPLNLNVITALNGCSNTALLTHVWMAPANYTTGQDPTDAGWHTKNNARSCNSNFEDGDDKGSNQAIGSPHGGVNLFLFADNHITKIPYTWAKGPQMLPRMWAYNCTEKLEFPN